MILDVPVYMSNGKEIAPVEIQIRTIAMDFWASLEHQMKYKKDVPGSEDLVNRLSQIADRINQTDMEMQEIREEIQSR